MLWFLELPRLSVVVVSTCFGASTIVVSASPSLSSFISFLKSSNSSAKTFCQTLEFFLLRTTKQQFQKSTITCSARTTHRYSSFYIKLHSNSITAHCCNCPYTFIYSYTAHIWTNSLIRCVGIFIRAALAIEVSTSAAVSRSSLTIK